LSTTPETRLTSYNEPGDPVLTGGVLVGMNDEKRGEPDKRGLTPPSPPRERPAKEGLTPPPPRPKEKPKQK